MNTQDYKGLIILEQNGRYFVENVAFNKKGYASLSAAKGAITKLLQDGKQDTVTVIRIENEHGKGMYNTTPESGDDPFNEKYPSLFTCPGYHNDDKHHPRPEDDSLLLREMVKHKLFDPENYSPERLVQMLFGRVGFTEAAQAYSYGFADAAQARRWIYKDEWLSYLGEHGFHVAVITLPAKDVLIGNTQAMFIKPKKYDVVSIKEFFKIA